ncbi:hypothetical protein BCR44DRAFT_374718 [Catenaria anguillulae PL171]|uniref:Uncharacterized protein n=1 Tax=Catenaria anguillulae PL171 TaxID=765915 RepID=A0A1Y2HPE0_9FUNG|nr:hypothetical protein BCR44DRAFT_374718 [Catenaria anguillulae PL171]
MLTPVRLCGFLPVGFTPSTPQRTALSLAVTFCRHARLPLTHIAIHRMDLSQQLSSEFILHGFTTINWYTLYHFKDVHLDKIEMQQAVQLVYLCAFLALHPFLPEKQAKDDDPMIVHGSVMDDDGCAEDDVPQDNEEDDEDDGDSSDQIDPFPAPPAHLARGGECVDVLWHGVSRAFGVLKL